LLLRFNSEFVRAISFNAPFFSTQLKSLGILNNFLYLFNAAEY
jgi:hypothetical protein